LDACGGSRLGSNHTTILPNDAKRPICSGFPHELICKHLSTNANNLNQLKDCIHMRGKVRLDIRAMKTSGTM
jgi:hypothetical protein